MSSGGSLLTAFLGFIAAEMPGFFASLGLVANLVILPLASLADEAHLVGLLGVVPLAVLDEVDVVFTALAVVVGFSFSPVGVLDFVFEGSESTNEGPSSFLLGITDSDPG